MQEYIPENAMNEALSYLQRNLESAEHSLSEDDVKEHMSCFAATHPLAGQFHMSSEWQRMYEEDLVRIGHFISDVIQEFPRFPTEFYDDVFREARGRLQDESPFGSPDLSDVLRTCMDYARVIDFCRSETPTLLVDRSDEKETKQTGDGEPEEIPSPLEAALLEAEEFLQGTSRRKADVTYCFFEKLYETHDLHDRSHWDSDTEERILRDMESMGRAVSQFAKIIPYEVRVEEWEDQLIDLWIISEENSIQYLNETLRMAETIYEWIGLINFYSGEDGHLRAREDRRRAEKWYDDLALRALQNKDLAHSEIEDRIWEDLFEVITYDPRIWNGLPPEQKREFFKRRIDPLTRS